MRIVCSEEKAYFDFASDGFSCLKAFDASWKRLLFLIASATFAAVVSFFSTPFGGVAFASQANAGVDLGDEGSEALYEEPSEDAKATAALVRMSSRPAYDRNEEALPVSESPVVKRLAGPIALDTMQAIVKEGFPAGSCDSVVLATSGGYWDALTASGLAGLLQCPVLLTDGDTLSPQAAEEIERLGATNVYIAGGSPAVSDYVVDQVASLSTYPVVRRLAGEDARGTARQIYEAGKGSWGSTAIVATSDGYWDGLSASPYAYAKNAPIFLTNPSTQMLDPESVYKLRTGGFTRIVLVGSTVVVSDAVKEQLPGMSFVRLGGIDAYETSRMVANWCVEEGMGASYIGFATGGGYWDALSGASLCGSRNSVLLLVDDGYRENIDFARGNASSIDTAYVFGGSPAVSDETFRILEEALTSQ